MTNSQKKQYKPVEELLKQLSVLAGQKYQLTCGHHVTFNHFLGNNIMIHNGKELTIVCSDCGR